LQSAALFASPDHRKALGGDCGNLIAQSVKTFATRRVVWLFPAPVRTAVMETTGLVDFTWVEFVAHHAKNQPPAAKTVEALLHDNFMGTSLVGENDLVYFQVLDQSNQFTFWINGNSFWIQGTRQSRRIFSTRRYSEFALL